MSAQRLGPSTRAIHGKLHKRSERSPVADPVVQSSTFVNRVGSHDEVLYTRYGNNPNQLELSAKLAALEGADAAIVLGSGMSATALAHLAVLQPGDHLLATSWIYGGTKALFEKEFPRFSIDVTFVNPENPDDWKRHAREKTRALFVETPTNPLARVLDLKPLAKLCAKRDMTLIVDSTFGTPINLRPLSAGADIVIHSATKYLNGHSDVIAGVVAGKKKHIAAVRSLLKLWGPAIDPHAAWLIARGLKTLAVRMERHNANGMAFATWAEQQPAIRRVHYPGLESHPDHDLAARTMGGFGGIVGIEVQGGAKAAESVLKKLRLAAHAPSLGGVETLVSEPRVTSHAAMTPKERKAQGIADGFIRVSLGIEDVSDIIADFERALGTLK
jgi:cystathionine beta-lyase/cystathionine gamma-synthase